MATSAKPAASNRVTNVHTPGAPAKPAAEPIADKDPETAGHDEGTEKAKAPEAKTEGTAANASKVRPSRAHYAQMRAVDIDPTTLSTAVLSKDGWVCPQAIVASK